MIPKKEFIVNVVANTLRTIIIKNELENYTFKVCAFFCHLYVMANTNILSTEILNGMVHFHTIHDCIFILIFKAVDHEFQFQLLFSVFINSVMICRILSFSRDILGFSSFFLKTESMRTLSCLKMTAIFTGA